MCTGGKTSGWFPADVAGSDRPEEKFPTTSLQKGRWINNKVKNIVEEHDWRLGNEETEDIFKSNEMAKYEWKWQNASRRSEENLCAQGSKTFGWFAADVADSDSASSQKQSYLPLWLFR